VTEPDPTEFGAFATAVGRRYGDRVSSGGRSGTSPTTRLPHAAVRNGKPASPAIYRKLFQAGRRAALLRQPGDKILMGETAPIGNTHLVKPLAFHARRAVPDARWHKSAHCGTLDADGYAHHPYTKRSGRATSRRARTT
jgi:hypothetical protein